MAVLQELQVMEETEALAVAMAATVGIHLLPGFQVAMQVMVATVAQ